MAKTLLAGNRVIANESLPLTKGSGVHLDWWLLGSALTLLYVGLVMITSASVEVGELRTGNPFAFSSRHGVFLLLAISAGMAVYHIPVRYWYESSGLLLLITFMMLVLVLVVGRPVNGSIRWVNLGIVNFQPSEVAKLFVIAYVAGYLTRRSDEVNASWWGFVKPLAVIFVVSLLLLMEPDFGATVVITTAVFAMIFLSGAKLMRFGVLIFSAVVLGALLVVFQPYRFQRVTSFTDPWADQFGSGYQLTQALIAFGRGEWFGVGLGNSVQKLMYLPEAHTDFVFAIIAEEFGLVGTVFVVCLFGCLIWRGMGVGKRAAEAGRTFFALFAYGVSVLIGFQAFINMGVNSGLLPTKGLTLPLVSYGGSSLIVSCMLIGVLLRIDHETKALGMDVSSRKGMVDD